MVVSPVANDYYNYSPSGFLRDRSMLSAQLIKNQHSDIFTFLHGNLDGTATDCRVPEEALRESLVYVSNEAQLAEARRRKPAIVIVHANMADRLCAVTDAASCCFSVKNISMGMAMLLKYFDRKPCRFTQWGERHPTAVVHCDAVVGKDVFLGPYCVIGADAQIGDGCMIGAHCVVENGAKSRLDGTASCTRMSLWGPLAGSEKIAKFIRTPASAATDSATPWIPTENRERSRIWAM